MNNVILITGASGGIGESLARTLASKKLPLLLVARSAEKLKKLSYELSKLNGTFVDYIAADLSHADGPIKLWDEVRKRELSITTLINNAGIGSSGEFAKNDLNHELAMMQLNNASMVTLCHVFLEDAVKYNSTNASIINIGSMASFFPSPYMAVYAASKAFVSSFTLALAEECRPHNIHVLFFAPGLTRSNFMKTTANDNVWGKTLTQGAPIQSSDEVVEELIRAWGRKKISHISGSKNRFAFALTALIPNSTIARIFADRKRKKIKR